MKSFLIGMLLGVVVGGGGLWFLQQRQTGDWPQTRPAAAQDMKQLMNARLEVLELQADKVRKELTETGRVVRRNARAWGVKVADAAADARITAVIKTKLAAAPDLSAMSISVSTTNGIVTLSGKVASPELVGEAMMLALQTDEVQEVISTLQVIRE